MVVSCSGKWLPTRECVGAWTGGTRAQAGHLAPARSERSGEPSGLTGRARVTRWAAIRRTGRLWQMRTAAGEPGAWRTAPPRAGRPAESGKECAPRWAPSAFRLADRQAMRPGGCRRKPIQRGDWADVTARRAEASATVTRMGRDRPRGLGSPGGRIGRGRRRRPT